jgi:lipoic acid synthetase
MSEPIEQPNLPRSADCGGAGAKRHPAWLRRPIPTAGRKGDVEQTIAGEALHTVCAEAKCPNRGECYGAGTATFLIMGDTCTRSCAFCAINHGSPQPLDTDEPERICRTVARLGLRYVVITSVTRDDCPDGGAGHFARTIALLKQRVADVRVEVLIPDFGGSEQALQAVLDSRPDVLNHNLETIPRLYSRIRPQAQYERSLELLARASRSTLTKSGIMVGLGETEDEVLSVMKDLRAAGCSLMTIGQYLQPTSGQVAVVEYVTPQQFDRYTRLGHELGFRQVVAGPFVRSSYRAAEIF